MRPRRKDAGAAMDGEGWAFGQSGKTGVSLMPVPPGRG